MSKKVIQKEGDGKGLSGPDQLKAMFHKERKDRTTRCEVKIRKILLEEKCTLDCEVTLGIRRGKSIILPKVSVVALE